MADREKLIKLFREAYIFSIDKCDNIVSCELCNNQKYGFNCRIVDEIDYLLSHGVTFEKQGEWENDKEDLDWGNSLKRKHCTNCGKRPHFDREKREFILSDYCPNCGAKMKGENNG